MVPVMSLWIPILLAAVLVFVVSSIIHMVLGYHSSDCKRLPSEDAIMEDLRKYNIPPGDYIMPWAPGMKAMKDPAFQEKWKKGPLAFMTFVKAGPPSMGPQFLMWFLYCVVVGFFAAYVTGRAVGPGTEYLPVFRFSGAVAFTGYGLALVQDSIWYKRSWATTFKNLFDALVYGCVTAGTFGWLWPR